MLMILFGKASIKFPGILSKNPANTTKSMPLFFNKSTNSPDFNCSEEKTTLSIANLFARSNTKASALLVSISPTSATGLSLK